MAGASLKSTKDKQTFAKLPDTVKAKHRWLVDKFQTLPAEVRRKQLPESLDMTLLSLYELIRRQRNDLGHPQENPPDVSRDQAFVQFRLFPTFIKDVEAFAAYCKSDGL